MDAVLPLIGVVVGAILGGGVTFLLERGRERRSTRAAALLVQDELSAIWGALDVAIMGFGGSYVGTNDGPDWNTSEWREHRGLLAAGLSPAVWGQLAAAYRGLRFVPKGPQQRRPRERTRDPEKRPRPTAPPRTRMVFLQRDRVADAINALEAEAGLPVTTFRPSEPGPEVPPELLPRARSRDRDEG